MITSITGNLLLDDAQALVNTVNTEGVMGKGIALQFKEAFPENYKIYRKACKEGKLNVGQMLVTEERTLQGHKLIINFPTKTTWRRPSEYFYIESGLKALRDEIVNREIKSIAIPPLGSHNGGLDWGRVRPMIENTLGSLDCDIRLYDPSASIKEKMKQERVKLTPARTILLDVLYDLVDYGEFASVFAAEKVVYFLQRLGGKDIFKIQFERGYYGPYSKGKIAHVLYYLNGSYVMGMVGMQPKPFDNIWIIPEGKEDVRAFLALDENIAYRQLAEKCKTFLRGYYSNYALELLATVDFLINEDELLKDWKQADPAEVINRVNTDLASWSERKNRKFVGSKFMPKVLSHLRELPV